MLAPIRASAAAMANHALACHTKRKARRLENGYNVFARGQAVCDFGLYYAKVFGVEVKLPKVQSFSGCDKPMKDKKWRVHKIMARLPKNRLNKMRRLSTMIEPMVAHSARERGFSISRIISHWHDTVGDLSEWCRPADIHFPRGSRNNGTLKLQIASGRGPQAQAMTQQIIDAVNASFGYRAIDRITIVQSLAPTKPINKTQKLNAISGDKNIWALDERLKNIKSPELRAALRRLGGPIDEVIDDGT